MPVTRSEALLLILVLILGILLAAERLGSGLRPGTCPPCPCSGFQRESADHSLSNPGDRWAKDLPGPYYNPPLTDFLVRLLRNIYRQQSLFATPDKPNWFIQKNAIGIFTRMIRYVFSGVAMDCHNPMNAKCVSARMHGSIWPGTAWTMVGWARLNNLEQLILNILENDIPGDLMETGSWRGGAAMYMRLMLDIHGSFNDSVRNTRYDPMKRIVHICDSFEGLPKPRNVTVLNDNSYAQYRAILAVPMELVKDSVDLWIKEPASMNFVKGFFVDSMPVLRKQFLAQKRKLALLRLDGDMYESTLDVLYEMYDFVSVGGYIIVDDWGWKGGAWSGTWAAKWAVLHFKLLHGIWEDEPMVNIDGLGAYWQKTRDVPFVHKDKIQDANYQTIRTLGDAAVRNKGLRLNVDF